MIFPVWLIPLALIIIVMVCYYRSSEKEKQELEQKKKREQEERDKKRQQEEEVRDKLLEQVKRATPSWNDAAQKGGVLAYKIIENLIDEDEKGLFLDMQNNYVISNKLAYFGSLVATDIDLLRVKCYDGVGVYSGSRCHAILNATPWREIIDIRMVADTPTSRSIPHNNSISTAAGGVVSGNMIIPFTSQSNVTTYSTEVDIPNSGRIFIYTKEEFYSVWVKDVAAAHQTLVVYWQQFKEDENKISPCRLDQETKNNFDKAYALFKKAQSEYEASSKTKWSDLSF